MSNLEINDKVACIDDKFEPGIAALYTVLPKEGHVYVVRDVRMGIRPGAREGDISLLLVGLINPKAESRAALERGFSETRFRKLDELSAGDREARKNKILDAVFAPLAGTPE